MVPHMICVLPFLTTACQVRRLRISVPLAECLVDGQKYFLPDDLQPAAGEELRSLFRPRLRLGHLRTAHPRSPGQPLLDRKCLAQSLLNRFDTDRRPDHVRCETWSRSSRVRLVATRARISDRFFLAVCSGTFTAGMHPLEYRVSHGANTKNVML